MEAKYSLQPNEVETAHQKIIPPHLGIPKKLKHRELEVFMTNMK